MYVTRGGGSNGDFEKKNIGGRIMQFQTRNGMGYVSKKKKTREITVLWLIDWLGGGGEGGNGNSIKNGTESYMYAGMLLRKIESVFGCRNSNNLLIYQDLFF